MLFDLFHVLLNLFCKYFIEIICVHVPWGNCMIFIFDCVLIYFAYQSNLASKNDIVFPYLFYGII